MGSYKIVDRYRGARRRVRQMRRSYRGFKASVQNALQQNIKLRLAVYAVLLLAAAGAVIHMADVNAAVRPRRDMKWYMRPDAIQVAAPPMAQERFEAGNGSEQSDGAAEALAPAERDHLAAGILSLFAPARAEELPAGGAASPEEPAEDDLDDLDDLNDPEDDLDDPDDDPEDDPDDPDDELDGTDDANDGTDDADDADLEDELAGLDDPDGEVSDAAPAAPDAAEAPSGAGGEEGFVAVPMVIWDDEADDAEPAPTDAPKSGETVELTISAAGDCTLGGDVRTGGHTRFDKVVRKRGYGYFLAKVKSAFEKDDLTIVNLEGPLTNRKKIRVRKMYTFRGKPAYAKILKAGSVEVCNIANNHALDFDTAGLKETVKALKAAGIGSCGFGKFCTRTVKGVKVGFLGFTKWQYSAKSVYKAVKAHRKKCDLLIVSIHWGEEGVYKASKQQRIMGRAAIKAGADLVLGHHPHVFGGIEKYKGKYIVYSLGNFCFGGNRNPSDKRTYIFQQTFRITPKGVKDGGINILPCAVTLSRKGNDYRPAPMPVGRAKLLLKNVAKYSYIKFNRIKWMDGASPVKLGLVKKKK